VSTDDLLTNTSLLTYSSHCDGASSLTNAPVYFGNQGMGTSDELVQKLRDAEHDVLVAVMDWVEKGTAPSSIIATSADANNQITIQRPLCMYPKQAKYKGSGEVNKPESWECASLY